MSGSGVVDAHPARPADGRVRIRQRQSEPPAARDSCDLVVIGLWPPLIVGQSIGTAALVGHLERGAIRSVRSIRNRCGKWAQRLFAMSGRSSPSRPRAQGAMGLL